MKTLLGQTTPDSSYGSSHLSFALTGKQTVIHSQEKDPTALLTWCLTIRKVFTLWSLGSKMFTACVVCQVHVVGRKAGHHLGWKKKKKLLNFSKIVEFIIESIIESEQSFFTWRLIYYTYLSFMYTWVKCYRKGLSHFYSHTEIEG